MHIRIKTPEFEGDIKTMNYDNDGAFCLVTKIERTDRFIDKENPIIYLDTKTMIEAELLGIRMKNFFKSLLEGGSPRNFSNKEL